MYRRVKVSALEAPPTAAFTLLKYSIVAFELRAASLAPCHSSNLAPLSRNGRISADVASFNDANAKRAFWF